MQNYQILLYKIIFQFICNSSELKELAVIKSKGIAYNHK